jgi:mannose/fructose-specific phosphotransferase system component IIA
MTFTADSTKMIAAIVVTHGKLAQEFIATAQKIYGNVTGVYAVSNDDTTPQALASQIDAIIESGGPDDAFVILVDFLGGSCGHATLSVERRRRNVRVVSGVNLPMLLAFLNKRADVSFERLPAELASRGRDSIHAVDTDQL